MTSANFAAPDVVCMTGDSTSRIDVTTSGRVFASNYFACHANQTIALRDVHNTIISNNNFAGSGRKAIQLTDGTSGIRIRD